MNFPFPQFSWRQIPISFESMSECQNPHRSLEANHSLTDLILKEPVERYGLENGLTVVLKPDRSNAICSVQVWVKTGSIHEDDKIGAGLSKAI